MKIDDVLRQEKKNLSNIGVIKEFAVNHSDYYYLEEMLKLGGMSECVKQKHLKFLGIKITKL